MRSRGGIWERARICIGMSKPALNIRFSQAIIDKLDDLVDSGQYSNKADIVNQAVIEFLQREGLRPMIREELKKLIDEKVTL